MHPDSDNEADELLSTFGGQVPESVEGENSISSNSGADPLSPGSDHLDGTSLHSGTPSESHSLLDQVTNQANLHDGVFGNLEAKEDAENADDTNDNTNTHPPHQEYDPTLHFPGEDDDLTPTEQPPSYEEASEDATPSYFETTILSDCWGDEIIVGDMPVGSLLSFFWALLISVAFGIPGFFITYLFHTSHAAQSGCLVGLGWTLFNISYDLTENETAPPTIPPDAFVPSNPNTFEDGPPIGNLVHPTGQEITPAPSHGSNNQLSYVVFAFAILLIVRALYNYGMAYYTKYKILKQQHDLHTRAETLISAVEQSLNPPETIFENNENAEDTEEQNAQHPGSQENAGRRSPPPAFSTIS